MSILKKAVDKCEKDLIIQTLEKCRYVAQAAEILGIKRTTLVEKMRKHGITFRVVESITVDSEEKANV